jgi:hypothetical protein
VSIAASVKLAWDMSCVRLFQPPKIMGRPRESIRTRNKSILSRRHGTGPALHDAEKLLRGNKCQGTISVVPKEVL